MHQNHKQAQKQPRKQYAIDPALAALPAVHSFAVRVMNTLLFGPYGPLKEHARSVSNTRSNQILLALKRCDAQAELLRTHSLRLKNMPRTMDLFQEVNGTVVIADLYNALVLDLKALGILPPSKGSK